MLLRELSVKILKNRPQSFYGINHLLKSTPPFSFKTLVKYKEKSNHFVKYQVKKYYSSRKIRKTKQNKNESSSLKARS